MASLEQWQGQTVLKAQTCAAESRQVEGCWESSLNSWDTCMHNEQSQQLAGATQHGLDHQQMQEHHEQLCPSMKPSGCKRGGRPVTWIGGGGMDPKKLAGLGVPVLRSLFSQVFGQETASNNAAWLRRKLAESPDSVHGQRRSPIVRARDQGAAIWNQDQEHLPVQQEEEEGVLEAASMPMGDMQPEGSLFEAQQMQLDGITSLGDFSQATSTRTPPHSPAGVPACQSPSAASPAAAEHMSTGHMLGKRSRHSGNSNVLYTQQQQQEQQPYACCYASGVPLRPNTITDSCNGRKVLVYWPADQQWWEATLCGVNTSLKQLQLLYADMTEECVSGRDFDDLLTNGHLLDVQDVTDTSTTAGGSAALPPMVPLDKAQSAASALHSINTHMGGNTVVPCQPGPQDSMSGLSDFLPYPRADMSTMLNTQALAGGSQSCLLSDCSARASRVLLHQPHQQNAAVASEVCDVSGYDKGRLSPEAVEAAMTHNSSRRSTRDGFRCSGSGSGSGNNSASCEAEPEGTGAVKRQCYELSGISSDDAVAAVEGGNAAAGTATTPAAATTAAGGVGGSNVPAMQAQQQAPQPVVRDPSQLSLWFANQQLQQLHLQEQQQHNLELQQQAHLQMQQQMAAHMQMRVAEQVMQQQMAASPFTFAGAAVAAAAAAGMFGLPAFPASSAGMNTQGFGSGLPALPAISAPPNAAVLQQLASSSTGAAAAAAAAGQVMSPVAAMAYYSPLAASAAAASAALNAANAAFSAPPMAFSHVLVQQQQMQQAFNMAAPLMEPTSPLAAAAAAAVRPSLEAAGSPADNSAQAVAVTAAMVSALNSLKAPVESVLPQQLSGGQAVMQPVVPGVPLQLQPQLGANLEAPVVAPVPELFGQLPLPQRQPQPLAPLQPALPDAAASAVIQADAGIAGAAPGACAGSKLAKVVSIRLEPEYCTYAQSWMDPAPDVAGCARAAVQQSLAGGQQQQQEVDMRAPGSTGGMPGISSITAGCLSGFTGGVQGGDDLDEVDTLLSRPEEGLYGGLAGSLEGCGMDADGGAGDAPPDMCWRLLEMAGAPGEPQGLVSQAGGPPSGGCVGSYEQARVEGQGGRQGGGSSCGDGVSSDAAAGAGSMRQMAPLFSVPAAVAGLYATQRCCVDVAQWGQAAAAPLAADAGQPSCTRPNSNLAHVFDYA